MASAILAVKLDKCRHLKTDIKHLSTFSHKLTIKDVFYMYHPSPSIDHKYHVEAEASQEANIQHKQGSVSIPVDTDVTVGDLNSFGTKSLTLKCVSDPDLDIVQAAAEEATVKASNSFEILMAKGRTFPVKRKKSPGSKSELNQKDLLYNIMIDLLREKQLDFPKHTAAEEGKYFAQVLCNALWYVTNHHDTINTASRAKDVKPIPTTFNKPEFQNLHDTRKKKIKTHRMTTAELGSNSQALYGLLLKPVMRSTPAWCEFYDTIKGLAECLDSYMKHLNKQSGVMNENHKQMHPVRTVSENATVEYREKTQNVNVRYLKLDEKLHVCDNDKQDAFVFFDEEEHLEKPFENPMQRHRFIEEIRLSVPIDIYRFCPGGSALSTVCFVRVNENRTDPQMLTQAARFVMAHKHRFKEYHSRAQKTAFKSQLSNVAHVLPSVAELIYKELALDASVSSHPDTQERIRLIFLGEKGLLTDLRKLNPGRPSGTFDIFFDNLSKVVEEATAADERRHGTAHLSHWISLEDMIREAKDKCPNTPVPSKALVRLQFAPRNPFAKTSWNFTSRIDVQYKIQTRQLRLTHQDEHYCNALLKYFKEYAIEMNEKCRLVMICCDDKAKIPIGEPGFAVSTGVRGKKTVTPTSVTLTAGDHDMTKSSLTPSVTLQNDIPKSCDDSFVHGKVTVTVNDSVFQSSNPFRHAVTVSNILAGQGPINILMKYTDGGTDHRNTLESVKCASICLFREMNLDMLILGRCAPGHSWRNPAERVMSLLNLGLQNCSLERGVCSEEMEKKLKRMGSMKEIRSKAEPETRKAYKESVEPVQSVIQNRFGRLKLKNEPVCVKDPITDNEIDVFQRHLRELFPGLNLQKLQKQHTSKVAAYVQWKERHCCERHYSFQIKKCDDLNCCLPRLDNITELYWLPDPVLGEDKEHFRSFQDTKGTDTDERDRPSSVILDRAPKNRVQRNQPQILPAQITNHETEVDDSNSGVNAEPNAEVPPTTEPQADAEPGVNAEPQVQLNINAEPLVEQLPPTTEPQADAEPGVNAEPQIQLNINAEPLVEQLPPTTEPQADAEPGVNAEPQVQMNINAEPRVEQLPSDDPFLYTGQNARGVVRCVECRKPRVYYCKNKLSSRQLILLDRAVTEFDYTCGAPLSDPDDTKSVLKYVAVRKNLSCSHPIELAYYSSSIGKADICCYCGEENAYRDLELKKKYKTVLPICQECELKGKSSFVQRPFGKRQ